MGNAGDANRSAASSSSIWGNLPAGSVELIVPQLPTVCAAFGLEGRTLDLDAAAQSADHVIENPVVLVAKETVADLKDDVSVAKVVRDACEQHWVIGPDRGDILGCSPHHQHSAIRGSQQHAITQDGAARQKDGHILTILEFRLQTAALTLLERKLEHALDRSGIGDTVDLEHQNRK
jgi:hypothetical protein